MLNVSQNWKEKMGCYLMPNRDRLTPEELIKLEYNIDGQTLVLNKSDIINFTHTQNCDLNSLTLPKNEIQFEIDNSDGRWNPDNPTGLYQKITEKQQVDLYYGLRLRGQKTITVNNWFWNSPWAYWWIGSSAEAVDDYWTFDDGDSNGIGWRGTVDAGKQVLWGAHVEADNIAVSGTYTISFYVKDANDNTILSETQSFDYSPTTLDFTLKGLTTIPAGADMVYYEITSDLSGYTGIKFHPYMFFWDYRLSDFEYDYIPLSTDEAESYDVVISEWVEWHKAGTFYMSGWDTPQNGLTATFTATSQLDFGKDKFGEQGYQDAPTYKDVCETAFTHMGLSASQYSVDSSLDNYAVPATSTTKYKYEKWDYSSTYTAATESMSMPEGTTNVCDGNTYVVSANNWTTDYTTGEYVGTVQDATTGMLQLSSSLGFFTSATGTIGETIRTPYKFYYPYTSISSRYMDSNGNIINQSGGQFSLNKNYFNETKTKGTTHIEDVLVDTQSYPTNGYQDGYWWVYVGEVSIYTAELFKDTTDSAVIQYCANAAQCRIRYGVDGKIYIEPFDTEAELTDYVIDQFVSYKNAEYEMSKPIKNVLINNNYVVELSQNGENQQISNPLITSQLQANLYAGWLGRVINTRKEISGEWRSDMRLQPYDYIKVMNKYAVNEAFITGITYTFSGCFKGTYEGRVMKSINSTDLYGNYYAGDHNKANSTIS